MSFQSGGDIPWSVSHNAGRDEDLAFYIKAQGRPHPAPSLIKFGGDLRSREHPGYRFDLARNWALVESLLSHPTIPVQWIFVSKPLREALLGQARRAGASGALLSRADLVLRQPTDSLSHADHFHVRIYCSREDRLGGCQNRGPVRAGVDDHAKAVAARIRLLLPGLADPKAKIRAQVIEALVRLDARREALHLARALRTETEPSNQETILAVLTKWEVAGPELLAEMGRFLERKDLTPRAPLRQAYAMLGRHRGPQLLSLVERGLRSDRELARTRREPASSEAELAAHLALALQSRRLVPALIDALDSPKGAVRQAAIEAIRRITNHSFGLRWTGALPPSRRKLQIERWAQFWEQQGRLSREALVIRGFRQIRRSWKGTGDKETIRFLVGLTRGSDHLAHNANWLLGRQAEVPAARAARSPAERHAAWQRWFHARFPPPRPKRRRVARASGARRALAARRRSPQVLPPPQKRSSPLVRTPPRKRSSPPVRAPR
jgi:hypothetical protein